MLEADVPLLQAPHLLIEEVVRRDAVDPGREGRLTPESIQARDDLDRNLLGSVVRLRWVGHHPEGEVVDLPLDRTNQGLEGGSIARPSELHQPSIRRLSHASPLDNRIVDTSPGGGQPSASETGELTHGPSGTLPTQTHPVEPLVPDELERAPELPDVAAPLEREEVEEPDVDVVPDVPEEDALDEL